MRAYLYSFRVRLFLAVSVLVLQVLMLGYLNQRTNTHTEEFAHQVYQSGQQRANVYLLASLARRLVVAEDDASRQSILALMQGTIDNFEAIQSGLRNGDDTLELPAIRKQELMAVLDQVDVRWAAYRSLLEDFMQAESATQAELVARIDQQSVTVFTFSDRLALGINAVIEQETQRTNQLFIGITVTTLLATLAAVYIVLQASRSADQLTTTVSQFAGGDYAVRAEKSSLIEFDQLGQGFNEMGQRIETQIKEISSARDEAERSNQVKSAFLASMSHELRTPLNAIINFSRFLAEGDLGPVSDVQKETLDRVVSAARHLLNLINDVLDMSKIESGSLRLFVTDSIDMNQLLDSAIATGRSLLVGKSVEFQTEVDANLTPIRGDRQRILQIMLNIISNACKFTETGFVKVRAWQADGEIIVAVEDTGPGIPPEDYNSVFEPFKQTTSGIRKGNGTGLGMPISRNLAEVHGGRLWVESVVDKGSTFFVAIPIKADHLTPISNTERKHDAATTGSLVR